MTVCRKWCARARAIALLPCLAMSAANIQAQEKHVVSAQELHKEAMRPAEMRGANEAALRQLFSSEQAQQALKSVNIDYSKVDKAQNNFAGGRAGSLSDRDLLIIIIIAVLVIALVAVLH
jgi:hypothetical protein